MIHTPLLILDVPSELTPGDHLLKKTYTVTSLYQYISTGAFDAWQ